MNPIESHKHRDNRASIPSLEEAGYEAASPKVQAGKQTLELPLNPVTHRGQDPELFWLHKYDKDNLADTLRVDVRSLYRYEHVAPEKIIRGLYRATPSEPAENPQLDLFAEPPVNELFGNALEKDELDKVSEYYQHQDGWTNRLVQGDSHLVMASLLEREGMAGKVQCIYFDPPYGIKYGSNWQVRLNNREVKDGADEALSAEPEQIKAFRDTWELGIHSYLSYLRDRLLLARELLHESGSCFVQISDENAHLVRNVMDEVFGSENFCSQIIFQTTGGFDTDKLSRIGDYIIWYAKSLKKVKFRKLYEPQELTPGEEGYNWILLPDGSQRSLTIQEKNNNSLIPKDSTVYKADNIKSQGGTKSEQIFEHEGKKYYAGDAHHWKTTISGLQRLAQKKRIHIASNSIQYRRFIDDFPYKQRMNVWVDTGMGSFLDEKKYIVQTGVKVIQRCLLMTTDPGDLVLDPTCGSGTTAYVAEQWGRRWLTIDTSRIALNIAKQRLATAVFPYYHLHSDVQVERQEQGGKIKKTLRERSLTEQIHDLRQGFVYEEVPHITLGSLANEEPPATETLFDKPYEDKKRLRVCGPFTVETLQSFDPLAPETVSDRTSAQSDDGGQFEEVVRQHLLATGIKNGRKNEQVPFSRVELLAGEHLHAEGFYRNEKGEQKAYFHIGPRFGTVGKTAVNAAIKACRERGDANWLVVLGFSFESNVEGGEQTTSMGAFEVSRCRMHDDLLQEGLKKKPAKSAASFVTIGEPDIELVTDAETNTAQVRIRGLDIYDPVRGTVNARDLHDIAYWTVDDDYDGSNYVVRQLFFCGGEKEAFEKWRKGLDSLARDSTKKKAERTLRIELDDEAFDRLYGHVSHPISLRPGLRVAVRVVSQFGEESTKILGME